MYNDAVSTGLSNTASPQVKIQFNEWELPYLQVHISRVDAFLLVFEALRNAVIR